MDEKTFNDAEPSDQIPLPEHEKLLLATVDLEDDQSTDPLPDSPYGSLCVSLNQLRAEKPCPIVLISAWEPADSSPRFALNLALALAAKQIRVLLIEGDQTSSDLAAIFELPEKPGFFEWRRGEVWASKVVSETMMPLLSFIPAGVASDEQGNNQLEQNKESHRWSNLRRNYDIVFLYSPAALSTAPTAPDQPGGSQLLDLADAVLALTCPWAKRAQPPLSPKLDIPTEIKEIDTVLKARPAQFLGLIAWRN